MKKLIIIITLAVLLIPLTVWDGCNQNRAYKKMATGWAAKASAFKAAHPQEREVEATFLAAPPVRDSLLVLVRRAKEGEEGAFVYTILVGTTSPHYLVYHQPSFEEKLQTSDEWLGDTVLVMGEAAYHLLPSFDYVRRLQEARRGK